MPHNPLPASLRDVHLPEPVHSWPLAPLTVIMLVIIIFLCGWAGVMLWRRYQVYRYHKKLLQQLAAYETAFLEGACTARLALDTSHLLKQVAQYYYPAEPIVALFGQRWFSFLKHTAEEAPNILLARYFIEVPYQKEQEADLAPFFQFARAWMHYHFKRGRICLK